MSKKTQCHNFLSKFQQRNRPEVSTMKTQKDNALHMLINPNLNQQVQASLASSMHRILHEGFSRLSPLQQQQPFDLLLNMLLFSIYFNILFQFYTYLILVYWYSNLLSYHDVVYQKNVFIPFMTMHALHHLKMIIREYFKSQYQILSADI